MLNTIYVLKQFSLNLIIFSAPTKVDNCSTDNLNNRLEEQKHELRKSLEEEISELKRERNSLYQTINILQVCFVVKRLVYYI